MPNALICTCEPAIGGGNGPSLSPPVPAMISRVRAPLVLSGVHRARNEIEPALTRAREAVDIAGRGDWVLLQAGARLELARALHVAGDAAEADTHARVALRLCERKGYLAGVASAEAFLQSLVVTPS